MGLPTAGARSRLPDSSFAYIDSKGQKRLPINDGSHVARARECLLRPAKRCGIVPPGFFDGQLRKERVQGDLQARASKLQKLPRGGVTFLFTDIEDATAAFAFFSEHRVVYVGY